MARILAYTSPARGHLFPVTPILDELQKRGHEIALRTLASQVPLMRERGFDVEPINGRVEEVLLEDWRGRNARQGLALVAEVLGSRAAYDAVDLRDAIALECPDMVLVDINSWGALAEAERWGGPWAIVCPYPLPLRSRDVPPYGLGIPPARGPLGRLRDSLLHPLVTRSFENTMLPGINRGRAGAGLPVISHIDETFHRAPLLLYLTAEPFEYHRSDWPNNVVMVGPCVWEPPMAAPDWLKDIDQPVVLVTTSSEYQNDGRLVATALEALAHEPVHVVATLPAGDPANFDVPGNAHVERFVPHGSVLDRAVCAVTHGGMGATQKALARGVPVCAVPFGRDQLEVARRVEVARAGTRLASGRLTPGRLRAKVREAMGCRDGAQRVAAGFEAAGGPSAAADAVERRLIGQPSTPRRETTVPV